MSIQNVAFDSKVTSSTALAPLGQIHIDDQGRRWIYAIADGTVTAGYMCDMATDGSFDMKHTTTTRCGTPGTHWKFLGVADVDVTDNYYAWFWVGYGFFECVIEASYAAAFTVYTTANAGLPGTDSSSFQLDGFRNIDAGVSATRVTCYCARRLTAGICEAHD